MPKHSADLPDDPEVNPEMQYRLVSRIVATAKSPKVGGGTILMVILLLSILAGSYYVIAAALSKFPN